jgi:hypothetical protein
MLTVPVDLAARQNKGNGGAVLYSRMKNFEAMIGAAV